jgi:hypothetical protein
VDQNVPHTDSDHPELRPVGTFTGHDVRCWIYHELDGTPIQGAAVR